MARQRDYAAEYAKRVDRGRAAGVSRQRARGHFPAEQLPTGLSRSQRHLAALRRQVSTGEHAVYGEFHPFGEPNREAVMYRHFAPRSARRMAAEIERLPSDTLIQVVAAGHLNAGYADYRGSGTDVSPQWRTILTGTAEGPVNGPGKTSLHFSTWDEAIDELLTDIEDETYEFGFDDLTLLELRILP